MTGFFRISKIWIILTATIFLCLLFSYNTALAAKKIRIGAFYYHPVIFSNSDDSIKGFYTDLFNAIAENENWRVEYVNTSWNEGLELIKKGEIDILTSVAKTPERELFMDFCGTPVLTVWGEVYTHESSSLNSILEINGKKIAVMKNDINGTNFRKLAESFGIRCIYIEASDFDEVFRMIVEGRADAGVVNSAFGMGSIHKFQVKATGIVFNPFDIFFTTAKNRNSDILHILNSYLEKWKEDRSSLYYLSMKSWLYRNTITESMIHKWIWPVVAGLFIATAIILFFNYLLRKKIRNTTSEIIASNSRLTESEAMFHRMYESIKDAYAQSDLSGRIIKCNKAYQDMVGYSEEEIEKMSYQDITPEKWHDYEASIIKKQVFENGFSDIYEKEYIKKDGTVFPVEIRVYLVRNESGEPSFIWGIIRDITARKKAEDEKKRDEERLRSMIGIMQRRSDSPQDFLDFALHEAIRITGSKIGYIYHYDETSQRFTLNSWSKDVMKECSIAKPQTCYELEKTGIWGEAVRQRKPFIINDYSSENTIKKGYPEGHVKLSRFMAIPVFKKDRIIATVGVANKDTDYKEPDILQLSLLMESVFNARETNLAQEALRRSEARMSEFMSHVPALILIKDSELRPVYANEKFRQYFPFEEWKGKKPGELFDSHTAAFMVSKDMEALEKGHVSYEEEWTDLNGKNHAFLTNKFRIDIPDSEPMLGVIISNVTERKKAEAELHEMSEIFRLFMENNPIYVFIKDEKIRPVYLSRNFEKMLGRPVEEAIGKTMEELFPPDLAKSIVNADRKIIEEGVMIEIVEELEGKTYNTIKFPIMINGITKYLAGYTMDITEKRNAEQEKERLYAQLLQSQKMESIGRLAGGVAHDFNNMLQAIIGFSDMAIMKAGEDEALNNYLKEIQKAARRSADLTRQLLAFARKQTVMPRVLDLNDMVSTLLKMLARMIGEDIALAWIPGRDIWKIRMDSTQIDQILTNLAVNARDAIKGSGTITIKTDNIALDPIYCMKHAGAVPGEYVMLSVSDDGCGMEGDILNRIFEPFFTTKDIGEGSGLGLATVYGIVKQNAGFIDVTSSPGHGTAFSVYLPRHAETRTEEEPETVQSVDSQGTETIMIVEDEQILLNLGKAVLKHHGYRVLDATSPSDALKLVEEYKGNIDLLVTDVVMPEMNGRELAEKILEIKPDIKCLFMSGYATDMITNRGALPEGTHFIQKPFSTRELASKVKDIMENRV